MKDRANNIILKFSLWIAALILKYLGYNLFGLGLDSILLFWAIHGFGYTLTMHISKSNEQRFRIFAAFICVGALWLSKLAIQIEESFFYPLFFWERFLAASILFLCLCGYVNLGGCLRGYVCVRSKLPAM